MVSQQESIIIYIIVFPKNTQLCLKMAEFCFCFADEIKKTSQYESKINLIA